MPTPRDKQVITMVRPADLARIDKLAEELDVSRSALVYKWVLSGLLADELDGQVDEEVAADLGERPPFDGRPPHPDRIAGFGNL